MLAAWLNMILLKAMKIKFLNNALHKIYRGKIDAFTMLATFIYITPSFCEAALLLLFPKSTIFHISSIDDIEGNIRT